MLKRKPVGRELCLLNNGDELAYTDSKTYWRTYMKRIRTVLAGLIVASVLSVFGTAFADTVDKAAGVGAYVVTKKHLKKRAKEKQEHGEKLTVAEKHPTITAIGAGLAANQASHELRDKKKK